MDRCRSSRTLWVALLVLGFAGVASPAVAQVPVQVLPKNLRLRLPGGVPDAQIQLVPIMRQRVVPIPPGRRIVALRLTEGIFDAQVLGGSLIEAKKLCERELQAELELLENAIGLRQPLREKLELAGRVDLERFFADHEARKRSMDFGNLTRAQFVEQMTATRPLKQRFDQGIYGEDSLIRKVMRASLSPADYEQVDRFRQQASQDAYSDDIQSAMHTIQQSLHLSAEQGQTLSELLRRESPPRQLLSRRDDPMVTVLPQIAELGPQAEPLFAPQQWNAIQSWIRLSISEQRTLGE